MAHDVFVSYSQQDKSIADAVVARLEQDGSRCWVAPRDIVPGTSWGDAITTAIGESRVMVLILSANSNRSRQVIREVERAVASEVILLPFRIEPVDPTGAMAYFLGTEHWLDALTPPLERHIERLCRTVRLLVSGEPVPHEDLDKVPALLGRAKRRSRLPLVAGAAAVLLVVGVLLAILLGRGDGERAAPSTSTTPPDSTEVVTTTTEPGTTTSTEPLPDVGLEEVGRFAPVDPDPSDLVPPGPITGFAIDGNLLAYANGATGVTRVAIGDPTQPRAMDTFGLPDARRVAFLDDHLAVGDESGQVSVVVFPMDGTGGVDVPIPTASVTSIYGLEAADGHLYVSTHDYVGIIDARDPTAPAFVFEWTPPGRTGNPASTFVTGGVGYFGAGWDGLYIFDLADPSAPALLAHWRSPDWVIATVVVDGFAYVTLGDSGLAVLDVSDPTNPRLLGTVTLPGFASPLAVRGDHAFVGWTGATGSSGSVAVVDVSDPEAPQLVDSFGRFPVLGDLEVAGEHVFVSDETEGLVIFQVR